MMRSENALLRPPLALAVGLTLLALVATGCGLAPSHTERASDQWSNGRLVGTARLNNPVALQVDEAGNNSYIVWAGLEHELNFARLDEHAEVVVQQSLDLRVNSPLRPQLLLDPTGRLHLAWLDRWEPNQQLFYALLSADGQVLQGATALSSPEQRVSRSSMVLDPAGQTVELFWSDNVSTRPGCYHAALDWSGAVVIPAEMLIPEGLFPVAQADRQGFVHLAWRVEVEGQEPIFYYAVYDAQRRALGPDVVVSEPLVQTSMFGGPVAGARFDGPWLGLDDSSVYLAWMLESRQRGQLGAFTFYQAFPLPALSQPEARETFDYPPPEVTYEAVHVRGANPTLTGHPRFLDGQPAQQVLAYYTEAYGPGNVETLQIAVTDVQATQTEGQEIVNATAGASLQPSLAVDSQGRLHLAWIDTAGFNRYQVIYASTSAQAKETLNRVTTYEVVDKILGAVMSVLLAVFFVPLVLAWVMVPIAWLVIFAWSTRASMISDPHGRSALGLAMLLQLGIKVLFFSDLLSRVTFGSLLSPSLDLFLGRWILPLLLAVLSAGVAWFYLKRARSQSIFAGYLIYAAVDSFLTLVIYVALPMG